MELNTRMIRNWRIWLEKFPQRKNAPPKGWRLYLRTAWEHDQWSEAYGFYLRSSAWQLRRKAALRRAENKCQTCGDSERLHVHHISYERVGNERADDLRVLCRSCHRLRHSVKRGQQPIRLDPVVRRRRERALTA